MERSFVFTSESVTEGHPDKVCDQISDAILDAFLTGDPDSRVACETLATTGLVLVSGEVTTDSYVDIAKVVRSTLRKIGYINSTLGMSFKGTSVVITIDEQSPEIAQGVNISGDHEQGAGDQGLMFGYACNETPEFMPIPIQLAHALTLRLADVRKNGMLPWVRPDGKSQVSVEYKDDKPVKILKTVIATQHDDMLGRFESEKKEHEFIHQEIVENVIKPVLADCGLPFEDDFIVNGTGRFVFGGPEADTGLTGRKIIVDTYGGFAPHGGGAFSGKDPSKVDRSATYMARYIAKNIVAARLADRCEVQLSYSIGVAEPTSLSVKSFGTSKFSNQKLAEIIREVFPLKPAAIISHLDLKKPRFLKTASYGHFGREIPEFTWERIDMVSKLEKYL